MTCYYSNVPLCDDCTHKVKCTIYQAFQRFIEKVFDKLETVVIK